MTDVLHGYASAGSLNIRHGYTLDEVGRLTRAVASIGRWAMPAAERYDLAWSAIAEVLCAAEEPPVRRDLFQAGCAAIDRHIRDGKRSRGHTDRSTYDGPDMPRFLMFWGSSRVPSHEDRIVEKIAARQVLAVLTGPQRDAVLALATHGDYLRAAEAIGIGYAAFLERVRVARKRLLGAWHEGETPARTRRRDRRLRSRTAELASYCGRGHQWSPENTRITTTLQKGKPKCRRECRACASVRNSASGAAEGSTLKGGPTE